MLALSNLADLIECTPASFRGFASEIDEVWFEKALEEVTFGADAKLRNRKFPVDRTLWLVIGMGLHRDRSIAEVAQHLDLTVKTGRGRYISPGALPKARYRLGSGPVETLFDLSARHWSQPISDSLWRGLSLWAMDGTCLNVPATVENDAVFGRPGNDKVMGAFPQIRVSALMNLRTHVMRGMAMGGFDEGELTLMQSLWALVPDSSLTILDRGLHSWWAYHQLNASGNERHWMTLARSNTAFRVIRKLGSGDELVEITISESTRRAHPEAPKFLNARRLKVTKKGCDPRFILTSLVDRKKYPAKEVRALYAQRWEIEIGYGELKTHMLECEDVLRSKTAEGVRQEMYGIAIAFNLVRVAQAKVAAKQKLDPRRLSFRHSVMLVRNFMLSAWAASPGVLAKRVARLEEDLSMLVLPERRARSYPRQVIGRRRRYRLRPRTARTSAK